MTNQTPVWLPPPPRPSLWARLSTIQRVGLLGAALILPCCGGAAAIGARTGDPKPVAAVPTPATVEQLAGDPAKQVDEPTEEATPARTEATTTATEATTAVPAVTKKKVTVTKPIAFTTKKVNDPNLTKGRTAVRTKGVTGVRTLTYQVTMTGNKETGRTLVSDVVTRAPVTKVVAVGTKAASTSKCDPNYSGCVPIASDVDCAGGSGNGPAYVDGPIDVIGSDIYRLDNDHDGVACES